MYVCFLAVLLIGVLSATMTNRYCSFLLLFYKQDLEREGLRVTESIVVVDRQQGGADHLASQGVKMRSLVTLTEVRLISSSSFCPRPHVWQFQPKKDPNHPTCLVDYVNIELTFMTSTMFLSKL